MQSLKPGWKMVKFGDVVRQCKEKVDRSNNPFQRYIEGGHIDSEDIHIRRWGEFGSDYVGPAFHRIFRKGQVLYGSRRTYLKKVAVADFDGITANTTFVCETKDQNIFMQELLPFLMLTESFTNHSIRESKGSTNPYINWSDIAKYEFPLPPLEEQKRLAELLWAADAAIGKYETVSIALVLVRQKILLKAIHHKKTKIISCKNLLTTPPKNGFSPKINTFGLGFPTLSIGAVRDGEIQFPGNIKYAQISEDILNKFRLKTGDVLVVRGNGNKQLCGKAAIVSEIPQNCFYPDLLIKVSFKRDLVLPEFATFLWNDKRVHSNLISLAKSTNGIWKINGKDISQHKLQIPPIDIQKYVVFYLKKIKCYESRVKSHINSIKQIQSTAINSLLGFNNV